MRSTTTELDPAVTVQTLFGALPALDRLAELI
jgi:hypothetical protein